MRCLKIAIAVLLAGTALSLPEVALAQDRTVKITGFGAKSGVVRVFGVNSEAAMKAAAEEINKAGGVTLGDGAKAKFTIEFLDDRCNAEEGISVVRRIASTDAFVAVGPTCSNVAELLFGILQKKVGDASDSGLQFPIFADVAAKGGLAKISEWSFRNVPSEARDVQVAHGLGEIAASGSQDDLWRRREGLRALERDLWRDEGTGGG